MWWWILVWLLLLLGAVAALALLTWRVLVRRVIALGRQIGASADEVSTAMAPVREQYRPARSVLVDPSTTPQTQRRSAGGRRRRAR